MSISGVGWLCSPVSASQRSWLVMPTSRIPPVAMGAGTRALEGLTHPANDGQAGPMPLPITRPEKATRSFHLKNFLLWSDVLIYLFSAVFTMRLFTYHKIHPSLLKPSPLPNSRTVSSSPKEIPGGWWSRGMAMHACSGWGACGKLFIFPYFWRGKGE